MKKSSIHLLRILITVFTGLTLLACILVARLIVAPIDLEFARDTVEQQTASYLPNWDIKFDKASLGWDWQGVKPWINVEGLRLLDRRERLTIHVPSARVASSFKILWGDVEVSAISVDNARINLLDISGFGGSGDTSLLEDFFGENGVPDVKILQPLTASFYRFSNLLLDQASGFSSLTISHADIEIYRGMDLPPAFLDVSSIKLEHVGDDVTLNALVDADLRGTPARAQVQIHSKQRDQSVDMAFGFDRIVPKELVEYFNLPEAVRYVDIPITVDIRLALDALTGLKGAQFNAQIEEGYIYHPEVFDAPAPVKFGSINAHFDTVEEYFVFDQIDLSIGEPTIQANGIIYWTEDNSTPGFRFAASLEQASVADVLKYWPIARHPDGRPKGGRAWISKHMLGGMAKNVRFDLDIPPDGPSSLKEESAYELNFNFENIDTHFAITMPPVRGAVGHANLTERNMAIAIDQGSLVGMPVHNATALLTNIHSKFESAGRFTLSLEGDVRDVLTLIDNPPLRIPEKANLDIERFGGYAKAEAEFSLPLYNRIDNSTIEYEVKADLSNVIVKDILGGEGVTDATAFMHIVPSRISAEGVAKLNGVPLAFAWEEDLVIGRDNPDANTTSLFVSGGINHEQYKALSIDIGDYLQGNTEVEARLFGRSFNFKSGSFSAGLADAKLKVDQLGWEKSRDIAATANGQVKFDDNNITVSPLNITGEDLDVGIDLFWRGRDFSAKLDAKKLGANKFIADLSFPALGRGVISLNAQTLDFRPYFAVGKTDEVTTEKDNDVTVDVAEQTVSQQVIDLNLKANEALLLNGEALNAFDMKGRIIGGAPYQAEINAITNDTTLKVALTPVEDTQTLPTNQRFVIETLDSGALARGTGIFVHLTGGDLNLDIASRGWADTWQLSGEAKVENSLLVNAKTLGEGVTQGAIPGLEEYVDDEGLDLDVIELPFTFDKGLLDLDGLKANGNSLGLTMEGQIETNSGKILWLKLSCRKYSYSRHHSDRRGRQRDLWFCLPCEGRNRQSRYQF